MPEPDRFTAYAVQYFEKRAISVSTIKGFKSALGQKVKAPSSMARYIAAAKPWLALQRLEGKHDIDRDGVNLLLKPPRRVVKVPESLVPGDVRALLTAATEFRQKHYAWFVLLSLTTGARPGEVTSIQGEHFNAAKGHLRVFGAKTGVEREVPFKWSTTLAALAGKVQPGLLLHMSGARGGPETHYWRELLALAGLPVHEPRVLRATVASALAGSGYITGLEYTRIMGHSTKVAEKFYLDPNAERKPGVCIESWLEAEAEFKALLARCLGDA